ncbi:hypothetical protein RchiOBHm_Chr5g0078081 [Rosa chinensis]|uniref:Uncharacterized protein n=1 Tax=Rosa chinensis TaxID=74649 RepID=A0A2P6QM58_ROSCH|nr:hypothetical protein RchiOBHm_Chr5g0078081 [Rosa chinensis]
MPQDLPSDQEADDAGAEFTKVDLIGRYGRYIEVHQESVSFLLCSLSKSH